MITIGIPTVNGPHRLERCLSHIFKDDSVIRFNAEVIVVDDGSNEEKLKLNIEHCNRFNVQLGFHDNRRGVPAAWNSLCRFAKNNLIVLLNDDIEVFRYWLDAVNYTLINNPWIGTVGLNTTVGPKRELPPEPDYNESRILIGSPNHPLLSCSGSAFAFRRQDWESIGGFDERYFCFYEEIDFCLSLLQLGKRSVMLSYPLLHHYVGETTTSVLSDPQAVMNESQKKFEDKWQVPWSKIREKFNLSTMPEIGIRNEWNSVVATWR